MIIGIDFDGSCVEEGYFPLVGPTLPYAVEILKLLVEKKHKLILWTVRGSNDNNVVPAIKWFHDNGIKLSAVNNNLPESDFSNSKKIYYDILIDDKSLGTPTTFYSDGSVGVDWRKVYKLLKEKGIL
jgi:hypothetical protein